MKNPKSDKSYQGRSEDINKLSDKLGGHLKSLKVKYEQLEPATKKKLVAALAGTAALLAGISAVNKAKSKKSKK
jgi:hypothetical protein